MALLDDVLLYRRRQAVTVILVLMFCAFLGRLIQLQFLYFDELGKKSEDNSIRNIPKEPVRGYMFDRFGHLVVDNRPAFTVTVMPFEFDKKMIPALARLLSLDSEFVVERVKKGESYSRFAPVKIARDIDFKVLAQLEENREALTGVDVQVESKRAYSTPAHASHILGYLKEVSEQQLKTLGASYLPGDVVGSTGLEAEYQETLRGEKGSELSLVNVRGQIVGSLDGGRHDRPSVDGKNLILTMDFNLQAYAESLLTDRRGAIVAIDPQDGGILAMVSRPDYDLNQFSGVTPPELWRDLNEDEGVPLYNRATLTRYPPGSTFKMIAAIAALEDDIVRPSWTVSCGGAFRFGNKVFKDLHVHGSTDMLKAIQASCNVYFYQLMLKVGLDKWSEVGKEFGFGQITGIDIAEESPGLLPSTAYMNKRYGANGWTRGFIISLGIGQGELGVTPLQMACYAMALGNQGQYHQPHAVLATFDRDRPNSADTLMTDTRIITLKPSTWSVVREGMRRVVMETGGTGGAAKIAGIQAAGKTGTAQNPHGPDHAWFIGFAPFDHPVIAIAVLVENAGFGGAFAAPIAGKCMERYMRNLGLIKTPEAPKPVARTARADPAPTAQN